VLLENALNQMVYFVWQQQMLDWHADKRQ